MRIHEILFWNDDPVDASRRDPYSDIPQAPSSYDLTKLAHAFTRRGLVKHHWNLNGSEEQPFGPAPPDTETELLPNGTLEPTTASWQAEPVEEEPLVGQYRLVPFRRYQKGLGD
jgi:hypothetical protein